MKPFAICILLSLFSISVSAQRPTVKSENSEFFLEIRDAGSYTVSVNDQVAVSAKGRFRFFDLPSGRNSLAITQNGKVIFKEDISLLYSNRTLASYSKTIGFKINRDIPLYADGRYRLDNWDKIIAEDRRDYEGGGSTRPVPNHPRYINKLSADDFARLRSSMNELSFDDEKLKLLKIALKDKLLYVDQLTVMMELFDTDDTKVDCALFAYEHIIDRDHFYHVRDYLIFQDNKEKIDNFLLEN